MSDSILTTNLSLSWSRAPWDEAVCGFPVLQITHICCRGPLAATDIAGFNIERDRLGAGLVSCRLPHDRLVESMLLEDQGFRFIEMTYAPELELINFDIANAHSAVSIAKATEEDLHALLAIAGTSFQNERFKMDPRIDPSISDRRFENWVANSLHHTTQEVFVVRDGSEPVALFITELLKDGTCYWHLNAIAIHYQGQGYGRRVWCAMLEQAKTTGASRVRTSIAARNHRVLNLYARLGFKFSPPQMTFHWVRSPTRPHS